MDTNPTYCTTRRSLEKHCWALVSEQAAATGRLIQVIQKAKDHQLFVSTRSECRELHNRLISSREDLQEHRSQHGC